MRFRQIYISLLTAFVAVFISLQTMAMAHAVEFGDAPHEHDGVVCVIDAVSVEDQIIVPTPPVSFTPIIASTVQYQVGFQSISVPLIQSRAPPPRAPPAFS